MHRTVIADTSCFIILTQVEALDILHQVYGQIITTPEIAFEFGEVLPEWVEVIEVTDKNKQLLLELQIDKGEASAIALALEFTDCKIILDDYKARRIAQRLGLDFTGTLGVIIKAKLKEIIPSIKPLMDKIRETDFRISAELEALALKEAGE